MDIHKDNWNEYYKSQANPSVDHWIESYYEYFEGVQRVLDLGCGNGSNIPFLLKSGLNISALDYSVEAITSVKNKWNIDARVHDIRNILPFKDNYFDVILADLSLHYFSYNDTLSIIKEIYRITNEKGFLICRVNSTNDISHGSMQGNMIEEGYYEKDGIKKRFFDENMVYELFDTDFVVIQAEEKISHKYKKEKALWEILAVKIA